MKDRIELKIVPFTGLKKGGNGGGDDMLEARVAKLEANVEHIASDTNEIKLNLRVTSSDVAELKTDTALSKRDIADIKADTNSLKQDFITMNAQVSGLNSSINSFKTTIKVSAWVISAAVVVLGAIAGPYLAKIASILNELALKS